MAAYYLAVDIGASSGRHILGHMENGKMVLEEIYRFENGMVKKDGELCWEFDRLFKEVVNGLKKCKEIGKIPVSMGVDTWGVDFVLLDKDDKVLGNTVGYRDHRTEGMDEEVYKAISLKDLYARTGIQKADYNTIYQLMAVKKKYPEYLEQAETLLHVPDYFHFLLTGQKACEYTEATTGQLVSPITKDWDYELIDMLGYPRKMFQKLIMPGTSIGHLSDKIREEVLFSGRAPSYVAPPYYDCPEPVVYEDGKGIRFTLAVKVVVPQDSVKCCDGKLLIEGEQDIFVYFTGNTDFGRNADAPQLEKECMEVLEDPDYEQLKKRHLGEYHEYFNRMGLSLNDTRENRLAEMMLP